LPVAVPTETVYGLAADATSDDAVAAIYAAKDRPPINPLIVHVANIEQAVTIGVFGPAALALANKHWPGPLTIVVPIRPDANIAAMTTAGLSTVAVRVPRHRVMQALLQAAGRPLAAPSANASGTITPTRAEHVLRTLDGKIPMIIDDGQTAGGIESTIVKVDGDMIQLLRHGPLFIEGAVTPADAGHIEAPGQLKAHYAPSKPLRLEVTTAMHGEWHLGFGAVEGDVNLSRNGDVAEAASNLFDLLHAADQSSAPRIAVAPIPETGVGLAINDRLRRAAAGAP
jgi:L-threonylcarbamoyladenylate synthase